MKRYFVAATIVAGLVFAVSCGGDDKSATEPPNPPADTADAALSAPDTVEIKIAKMIGDSVFADGNTTDGGQGETVHGLQCGAMAGETYHIHIQLSLYVNGVQLAIPKAIGVKKPLSINGFVYNADKDNGGCYYWVHTHDASGIIHVEPPMEVQVTLGQLFDLWGMPLSSTGAAGYHGTVTTFLDGKKYDGDPRAIVFQRHQQIALEVGTPIVTPDYYIFPAPY